MFDQDKGRLSREEANELVNDETEERNCSGIEAKLGIKKERKEEFESHAAYWNGLIDQTERDLANPLEMGSWDVKRGLLQNYKSKRAVDQSILDSLIKEVEKLTAELDACMNA